MPRNWPSSRPGSASWRPRTTTDALYAELIALSAATMGWAQGIARRRGEANASGVPGQPGRRIRKEERKRAKRKAKGE